MTSETRAFLASIGLPPGDVYELPDSPKRFPDGAQYRVEIPSVEGPACLEAVLEEADRLEVRVHRVSQGSGVFLQTDEEIPYGTAKDEPERERRGPPAPGQKLERQQTELAFLAGYDRWLVNSLDQLAHAEPEPEPEAGL